MSFSSRRNTLEPVQGPHLEVVEGAEPGRVFALTGDKLTIGRADGNDIVIPSEGISRLHAMLVKSEGAWFIRDNKSKNGLLINGEPIREAWLTPGDTIQVGELVFRFQDNSPDGGAIAAEGNEPALVEEFMAPGTSEPPKKKNNLRTILLVVVVLGGLYLFMNGEKSEDPKASTASTDSTDPASGAGQLARDFKVTEPKDINYDAKAARVIGLEDPILKKAEQEMAKLDWTNSSLREAEQFFRKGQREYLTHSYHRAIESFQTALALYRGHLLAERYLRRAIYEVEIEAKKHMQSGIRYYEALQYQRAMYHFNEVISLMAHRPNEAIIQDAEKYIQQSKKRLQAAELFP